MLGPCIPLLLIISFSSELARRKLQWVEYEFDYRRSQSSKDFNKLSDKERFEKNRRRRLLKEQESKQNEEETKSSTNFKCSQCKVYLIPPLKVYICQEGHLHREEQWKNHNIKVTLWKLFKYIFQIVPVLPCMLWSLQV